MTVLLATAVVYGSMMIIQREAMLEKMNFYKELAAGEKAWILQCQNDDGLILHEQWGEEAQQRQIVYPYFSSIAALGLLAGTVTEEQADSAGRYLIWYLDHLNTAEEDPINGDGTIYNYCVIRESGKVRSEPTREYDSVDSYAAMFFIVADAYAKKVDVRLLLERKDDVQRVAKALLRTLGENGLSNAKAEYPVQYLMDNSEVYGGLRSGADLLERIEPGSGQELDQAADRMAQSFDAFLWNSEQNRYEIGLMEDGQPLDSQGWDQFYPDSIGQLFPGCFQVPTMDPLRTEQLYTDFCQIWQWENLEHRRTGDNIFYWGIASYAAALQEDEECLQTFLQEYHAELEQNGRKYPLYTGDSGWVALACGYMEDVYRNKSTVLNLIFQKCVMTTT